MNTFFQKKELSFFLTNLTFLIPISLQPEGKIL